ncbi:MAG: hypothetical protein WCL02_04340 [bacterium]
MSEKDIENYHHKLEQSSFYTSLVAIIKKYLNQTLVIHYTEGLLTFVLTNQFGQDISFAQLSHGEQYLLSMIFTMYGYDLSQ